MAAEPRRHQIPLRQLWTVLLYTAVVLVAGGLHNVDAEKVCFENQRYQGTCGTALADLVSAVCRWHGRGVNKRSDDWADIFATGKSTDFRHPLMTSHSSTVGQEDLGQHRGADPKLDVTGLQPSTELRSPTLQYDSTSAVFLPKSVALTYARTARSVDGSAPHVIRRRGIVCECCVHRCSISELLQYCAPPTAPGPFANTNRLGLHGKRSFSIYRPQQQQVYQRNAQHGQLEQIENSLPMTTDSDPHPPDHQPDDSFIESLHGGDTVAVL